MSTAYFYDYFVTRKIRFSNRSALVNHMNYSQPYEVGVEGCYITNTTSYIDIIKSDAIFDFIYKSSYVRFVNNSDGIEYFAFIDRVEPNNFNAQNLEGVQYGKYYRVYITVDWWTTIMYKDDTGSIITNIKKNLEGNVERAHVNDIEKLFNSFHYTIEYTNEKQEFPIEKYVIDSKRVGDLAEVPTINNVKVGEPYFLYIITSTTLESGSGESSTEISIGDRKYPQPLSIAIIPTFSCNVHIDTYITNSGTETNKDINSNNFYQGIDCITDSSVYGIYATNTCPLFVNGELRLKTSSKFNFSTTNQAGYNGFLLGNEDLTGTEYVDNAIINKNTSVSKPNNYDEYLAIIAKQYFSPYKVYSVDCGGSSIPLDTARISAYALFEYVIIPSLGGYALKINSTHLKEESRYKMIINGGVYERLGTNDEFTQRKRLNMILSGVSSLFSNSQRAVTSASSFNFGTTASAGVDIVRSSIDTYNNYKKSIRDGEYGYTTQAGALSEIIEPLSVTSREPTAEIKTALRRDLALHGYTTYLHPHEILEGHERKYFNYLKLNNAELILTDFNTEIKLHIEEMFNNGVWLWNTNENFGNFEVPNYPKLMD